ncbi:MAG: hypothetical protein AB7O28_19765 [Vicinamibacterales bacterium]
MTLAGSTPRPLGPPALAAIAESPWGQALGVVLATLLIGLWHAANDGLWFQGDSPRHAATGQFFWDLLTAMPRHPLDYALSYFARYPVIVLGAYPPLFHLAEAAVFGATGPSAYVAKGLVLLCAAAMGGYAMLWGRRWIGPLAGWAGACTVLLPWMVQFSNAVLLNVPAAALGLAALYHCQAWIDTGARRDRTWFAVFTAAAIVTYVPGAIVVPMAMTWMLLSLRHLDARVLWVPAAGVGAAVAVAALVLPEQFARQGPSLARLVDPTNWRYYAELAPRGVTWIWIALGAVGVLAGVSTAALRRVTVRLLLAMTAAALCLAVLPARDVRYAVICAPLLVLAGFVGVRWVTDRAGSWRSAAAAVAVALLLGGSVSTALATPLKRVSGIEAVADFLRKNGPTDSVLYSGVYDGVFSFYVRAMDPGFERRVVLSSRFLGEMRQEADFTWRETLRVQTPADVVALVQQASGCRWVAVEIGGDWQTGSDRLLIEALGRPEFERVRSFDVEASPVRRIDLYRFLPDLQPAPPVDLTFPSFTARVFPGVEPIPARR